MASPTNVVLRAKKMESKSDHDLAQIIWVMGNSATGKETFIAECMSGNPVIQDLGWQNKTITFSQVSVSVNGQSKHIAMREKIRDDVAEALNGFDIVLIKWQYEDFSTSRFQAIASEFKHVAKTAIIELVVELSALEKRLMMRPWWDEIIDKKAFIRHERGMVTRAIDVFQKGADCTVTKILSKDKKEYEIVG